MATLVANANGVINGRFTIPANIRSGTKSVRAVGQAGSTGQTTFTGRGTLTIEERRRVTNITELRYDPLAQTFTLAESRHVGAIDLLFTARGTHDVTVQIRDTSGGFPGVNVLAESRKRAADILEQGDFTTFIFDPVWLDAGREYCFVVLTDDPNAAVRVATLGKFDNILQKWITSQAYQVGVLLSSSNASTWTAHQDKDLWFRLHALKFTQTAHTVDLGTVNVSQASDLLAQMSVDIPATGTNAEIIATAPNGDVFRMGAGQPIAMPSRINGDIAISLAMAGTEKASPVLYPGIQFIAGTMQESGSYVTRAFPVGSNARVAIVFEGRVPGTSTVAVEIQLANGSWQAVPFSSGTNIGDGWVERSHILTGVTLAETRVRITMTGNAQYRPRVRKLRAVATNPT